jgi:hypothetical protein
MNARSAGAGPTGDELELLATATGHAASNRTGAALDDALADIGWIDALEVAPRAAIASLFESQGAACHTSGALAAAMLAVLEVDTLGFDPAVDVSLVLPAFGGAALAATSGGGGSFGVRGLLRSTTASTALVVCDHDGALRAATVEVDLATAPEVGGLDPDLGLRRVETQLVLDGTERAIAGSWIDAIAIGRLALGHELVGTMQTMLELARLHALDRVQFGRPIAGFQAVRHRLAEALVAIEAAEAALDGAWTDRSPTTAAIAKAVCGHSARTVRRHAQQVLAGIGFTTEHDLHRSVRRSIVLDGLLGDARTLTEGLGADVRRTGELPPALQL